MPQAMHPDISFATLAELESRYAPSLLSAMSVLGWEVAEEPNGDFLLVLGRIEY